ncbi:MAG: hypothetical protein IKK10_00940 [Clostridia bacterium]|nr:hypothetical protein [Clostridia bacterium]
MSFYDVLRRFELLSSLDGKDLSRYQELCKEALEDVRGRLKVPEESLSDGKRLRLAYAAGALAFYKYCLLISATEPESFSAGEVKVTISDKKLGVAKRLFEEECKGLSDVLCDEGFYFGRVKA